MRRSSPRSATSAAARRTAPSCSSGSSLALPATATANDVAIGELAALAGAIAERRHAPGRHRVTTGGGRALAAAVRVVDRVHRHAAGLRAYAEVAAAPGLADLDVLVLGVS